MWNESLKDGGMSKLKSADLFQMVLNAIENNEAFRLIKEEQNADYEGSILQMNNCVYRTRLAKLTPKKKGYFVAFWEKDLDGKNQAYRFEEAPEKLIVSVIDGKKCGQFIFPKNILLTYGILKSAKQKGKMAMRVYPSWVSDLNETAKKTQAWQIIYFIDLSNEFDAEKVNKLYSC